MKLVLIGLDGATFSLLDTMMDIRLLPRLKGLVDNGVRATLRSVFPPYSAAAWASFMTGKNPGKHGLFDFRLPMSVAEGRPFADSRSIRAATMWRLLSVAGRRVVVLNVPMTYPAEPVNGALVGGMLEPVEGKGLCHPPELYGELVAELGGYQVELDWNGYRDALARGEEEATIKRLIRDVIALTDLRKRAALYLMRRCSWDVLAVVFVTCDRVQHFVWRHLDPSGQGAQKPGLVPEVQSYYCRLDEAVGGILDEAGRDCHAIVLSDHGFGPQQQRFFLNRWLKEAGYLQVSRARFGLRGALKKLDFAGLRHHLPSGLVRNLRSSFNVFGCIDWTATRAYSGTSSEQGIFVNLKGREPQGIVAPGAEYELLLAELTARLLTLRDERGEPLVDRVWRREEIYRGPYVSLSPDLLFSLQGMRCLVKEDLGEGKLFEPSGFESGSHRPEGILIAAGPEFRRAEAAAEASILDLAPTVLHLMEVPVPRSMDGRVLANLFRPGSRYLGPVAYTDTEPSCGEGSPEGLDEEAAAELERRLRGLGYLG
jgi:predicted AlkP superfamily phosphohydrolase/phosphomutase